MREDADRARGAPLDALAAVGVGILSARAGDDRWRVVAVNDAYLASLPEAHRDTLTVGATLQALPSAVAATVATVLSEARRDGASRRPLARLDFPEGPRWQRWAAVAEPPDTVTLVSVDMTEAASLRHRAAVHDVELAAVTDGLRDAVVLMNADRRIRYANAAASRMLGEPLVGDSWLRVRERIGFRRLDGLQQAVTVERALAGFDPDPVDVRFTVDDRDTICRAQVQPLRLDDEVIGAAVVLSDITDERRLALERKSLLARELAVHEQVRNEVAAALHDGVLQTFAELSVLVGAAATSQRPLDAALVQAAVDRGVEQCRRITEELRPSQIDAGTSAALAELVEAWRARGLLDVTITGSDLPRLEPWRETLLYQVAVEALRNALKHARGSSVRLVQERRADHVVVTIVDDGPGATPAQRRAAADAGHLGLVLSRERMEAAGGSFSFDSPPSGGSVVTLTLPIS